MRCVPAAQRETAILNCADKTKRCYRIAEIQEDCRRLANVETGEKETPLGEKETPLGEKATKVGEKANFVGEKKFIHCRLRPVQRLALRLQRSASSERPSCFRTELALNVSLADRRSCIEPEDGGAEFAQRRHRQLERTEVRDDAGVVVEDTNGKCFVVTQACCAGNREMKELFIS